MITYYDEDACNTIVAEDKAVRDWEQKERKRILNSNMPSDKKQTRWNKLYGRLPECDLVF